MESPMLFRLGSSILVSWGSIIERIFLISNWALIISEFLVICFSYGGEGGFLPCFHVKNVIHSEPRCILFSKISEKSFTQWELLDESIRVHQTASAISKTPKQQTLPPFDSIRLPTVAVSKIIQKNLAQRLSHRRVCSMDSNNLCSDLAITCGSIIPTRRQMMNIAGNEYVTSKHTVTNDETMKSIRSSNSLRYRMSQFLQISEKSFPQWEIVQHRTSGVRYLNLSLPIWSYRLGQI